MEGDVNVTNYFVLDDSPYYAGHQTIRINENQLKIGYTEGSRNVLMARLFNLPWVQFLRLCRDCFDAELVGKNGIYVVPYFPINSDGGRRLCAELNKRMAQVLANKT